MTADVFNGRGAGHLPGLVGVQILRVTPGGLESRLEIRRELLAPNGFLHAASVVALADTSCGYACVANLPQGASGFTTLELKSNGRGGDHRGRGQEDRPVPLHPDGPLAQVDRAGAAVFQSFPMKRRFFGYFFFPRPLAEGNG